MTVTTEAEGTEPIPGARAGSRGVGKEMHEIGEVMRRLEHLTVAAVRRGQPPIRNAAEVHKESLSKLDRAAIFVTDRVGSVGFFLIILGWTILWTGYNILATEIPALHWHSFDPFPAFVAYLLISNVIQILLMPLIMVGQNLQGRHSETRAQLDFEVNLKAEKEVTAILLSLEQNTRLILSLMQHLNCQVTDLVRDGAAAEAAGKLEAAPPA